MSATDWELLKTTRQPASRPVPVTAVPTKPTGKPGRRRVLIAVTAAAIAIAAGITGGILGTSSGAPLTPGLLAALRGESSGEITSAAFGSNGDTVITGDSNSGQVWLWNAASGKQVTSLAAQTANTPVAISPDRSTLAFASNLSQVELWRIGSRLASSNLPSPGSHINLGDFAFTPDGRTLAAGDSGNPAVYLYSITDSTLAATLTDPDQGGSAPGEAGEVDSVVFSPNGTMLAAADDESDEIFVWNVASRKVIATLNLPEFQSGCTSHCPAYDRSIPGWIAFSPDSGTLAVADEMQGVLLWNVARRAFGPPIPANAGTTQDAIAFSPDRKTLATGDESGAITLWNVASHSETKTWTEPGHQDVSAIAFSPDGKTLITGDKGGQAYLWNVSGS